MTTAIHLRTVDAPATLREKTALLRRLASGLILAASVSALSLIAADRALAQPASELRSGTEQPVPPGLTGAAWNIANQAYTAYEQKNYRRTIELVREALKLRPDTPQLWLLLMDALEADGRLVESVAAGNEAVAAGASDAGLLARLRTQSRMLAQTPSLAANKALGARDAKTAIIEARKAIALVPDDLSYRMLLVYALIADGQINDAEKAAGDAVAADSSSFLPKVLRGYLRERMGRIDEANADFDEALKDEVLTGETDRDVRVIIADAALAAGNPARALAVLEPLGPTIDPGVALRREAAQVQIRDPGKEQKTYEQLPVPFQKCTDTPYGPVCTLVPASAPPGRGVTDTPGFVTAQGAFAAYREGDNELAEQLIREALKINPGNAAWHRLLIETLDRANKLEALEAAIKDAVTKTGDDASLEALRVATDKKLAEPSVLAAIKAIGDGRAKAAVDLAREAVERSPTTMTFRIALIHALIAAGDNAGALEAADAALKEDENDPPARALQAWLLQKQGRTAESTKAFETLLASDILTENEEANYRLIAANAALSRGDAAAALAVLKPLPTDDSRNPDVEAYRAMATRMERSSAVNRPALATPSVLCQPTNYGVICSVFFGAAGVWTGGSGGQALPQPAGYEAATAAYQTLNRKDYAKAVTLARKALQLAPGNASYRQLLLSALVGAGRYGEAEKIISQLLARTPRDANLLVQRGNLRLQSGQYAGAISDFRSALNSGHLTRRQARNIRLAIADAALQAKDPELALATLEPMAGDRSYAVQSRLGYAWLALGDKEQALLAFEQAAQTASGANERNAMLTARINVLSQLGRKEEARALFLTALERGDLRGVNTVDMAVLASSAGEDEMAFDLFSKASDQWQLRGTNLIAAAYNARRTYHNEKAVDYLKAAIDEHREGKLALDPQYAFGLRREVAELTRTWGAYLSANYGVAGVAPNSYLVGPTNLRGRHTLALGGEVYWRPPHIGYRDGALFEVFARGFATAYDEDGGPTGADTFQPSVGVRWKPFKQYNIVLEASYLFPISKYAREDWLLRAAFSHGEGTDLRVDVADWRAWQIYGDFNYYLMYPLTVSTFELRYGHAWRMDVISDRLVLWPFLAFGGGYDNSYNTPFALGIGPGVNMRYWFREDEYNAPRSYVDLSAQYRFKLAGDDRAEGLFAGAFLSY